MSTLILILNSNTINYGYTTVKTQLTTNEVYPRCKPLEHVARVAECIGGETAPHGHHEQTDDAERYHCSNIICKNNITAIRF